MNNSLINHFQIQLNSNSSQLIKWDVNIELKSIVYILLLWNKDKEKYEHIQIYNKNQNRIRKTVELNVPSQYMIISIIAEYKPLNNFNYKTSDSNSDSSFTSIYQNDLVSTLFTSLVSTPNTFTWITSNNQVQITQTSVILKWKYEFGDGKIDQMNIYLNNEFYYAINFITTYSTGIYDMEFNTLTGYLAMYNSSDSNLVTTNNNYNTSIPTELTAGTSYLTQIYAYNLNNNVKCVSKILNVITND